MHPSPGAGQSRSLQGSLQGSPRAASPASPWSPVGFKRTGPSFCPPGPATNPPPLLSPALCCICCICWSAVHVRTCVQVQARMARSLCVSHGARSLCVSHGARSLCVSASSNAAVGKKLVPRKRCTRAVTYTYAMVVQPSRRCKHLVSASSCAESLTGACVNQSLVCARRSCRLTCLAYVIYVSLCYCSLNLSRACYSLSYARRRRL